MERRGFWIAVLLGIGGAGVALVTALAPTWLLNNPTLVPWVFWGSVALTALAFGAAAILASLPRKPRRAAMSGDGDDSEMGDYNTLYGKVKPPKRLGHGNTIVGATDDRGNTIIPGGTSVGYGAGHADPTSVFIGAFAGGSIGKKKPDEE